MRVIAFFALLFGVLMQLLLTSRMTAHDRLVFGIICGVVAIVCSLLTVPWTGGDDESQRDRFVGILMAVFGALLIGFCILVATASSRR